MSDHKDMTHRHLRHKLQSLGRRLDELEEATNKLQKSEDELLDLQDKIIQAEGSNSSLLCDVEALRKRLLKIQGKDEEVRKAEDLCRTVREKLEEEENLTKELKAEIERLQRRMAELEKLEEAFGKSKSDCSQLCLSLNEEKNLTKKLSSELETLKDRLKEVEGSGKKLEGAEMALAMELEKLKGFTQTFVSERKKLLEKQREDAKIIQMLTENLDDQKNRLGMSTEPSRADFMRPRIEDELSSTVLFTSKLAGRKKSMDYLKLADDKLGIVNKSENEKNSSLEGLQEEDNKVKELTQEVERLKNRLKQLEIVEEDLKNSKSKNGELHEKFQIERNRARQLSEQVEQLRTQLCGKGGIGGNGITNMEKHGNGSTNVCTNSPAKVLENGKAENEEILKGGFRQEKPKYRSAANVSEPSSPKHRNRELSPQHKREPKLRSKELSQSEDSSPKSVRRALSPAHKSRRTPKTPTSSISSDNGIRDTARGTEEKTRGATYSSVNTTSSDIKKVSVLSRYPPAANDQKPLRTAHKQTDGDIKKSREKFSKLYVGSDSESNNSDVVPESSSTMNSISALEKDTASASDQESADPVQESVSVPVTSSLSKANGSYTAYRSHITPLLPSDPGSEGHSSASETESTGSRPSEPDPVTETTSTTVSSRTATSRYARYPHVHDSHSEGSSSRSSFDEELHSRTQLAEGGHQGPIHTPSGIEIQRVCSPREALRSKAVIKPAIIEIDRKEVMISEPLSANGKPKISTKPVVTTTSKMTSSITIYPNDPSSSRTSSRSSSVSSEPLPVRERHTSTSNILIGPSSDHHGSISVPYEISIPKSEITLRSCQDQDCGADNHSDSSSRSKLHNTSRVETSTSHLCCQRSNFSLQSPDTTSADFNDTESGFESSCSSTTTVTSWRSQKQSQHSQEDSLPDTKNVTVRSTWRNKGASSGDEAGRGRGGTRTTADGGSEDEAEAATTWRAYRATTFDTEESVNSGSGAAGNAAAQKGVKPSPAEVYMRRINSVVTSTREVEEPALRRGKRSQSPSMESGGLGRTIPHAPVTSQSWSRSYAQQPPAADNLDPSPNPSHSPASWRRQLPSDSHHLGSSYDRSKTSGASSRGGELWSSRGQGSGARAEGRSGAGSRQWSHRQSEHH
ncbi:leucine zipper protein 1 [Acanthochromis polyacanthus]|uniref:Leucine zipper protein 1 n=1 Tax=Acanthochromis polyacanthus TaxID=80966 RepID=A0A3Q1F1U0_9TELE|nr:leucine zipper protein 1 [Acanthochromis polyacanthus]XP_051804496.1 leucine zipper protein 1 [Acanthochromis polyacanthus]XP_051804500.1 leucine zipper protein 1 [Acanthochromis polyacanthus]XP_051804503.1 leucine zipper protein 1 [Acanthochromis polyacanthus]XP_051804505.1 leucine zipper protein 1 [Acanthochromis polyacanthus]XP_051804507.1 leucine zipper protein 1 [Acanthochromis polyacanthus]